MGELKSIKEFDKLVIKFKHENYDWVHSEDP